jgi:hypothetical protein
MARPALRKRGPSSANALNAALVVGLLAGAYAVVRGVPVAVQYFRIQGVLGETAQKVFKLRRRNNGFPAFEEQDLKRRALAEMNRMGVEDPYAEITISEVNEPLLTVGAKYTVEVKHWVGGTTTLSPNPTYTVDPEKLKRELD